MAAGSDDDDTVVLATGSTGGPFKAGGSVQYGTVNPWRAVPTRSSMMVGDGVRGLPPGTLQVHLAMQSVHAQMATAAAELDALRRANLTPGSLADGE